MGAGQSQDKDKKPGKKTNRGSPSEEDNDLDSLPDDGFAWGDIAKTLALGPQEMTPLPEFPLPNEAASVCKAVDPLCQDVYVTRATGKSMEAAPDLTYLPPRSKLQDPFFLWQRSEQRPAYDASDPFSEWRPPPPPPRPERALLTQGASRALRSTNNTPLRGSIADAGAGAPKSVGPQKSTRAIKDKPREQLLSGPPPRREDGWAGVKFSEDEEISDRPDPDVRDLPATATSMRRQGREAFPTRGPRHQGGGPFSSYNMGRESFHSSPSSRRGTQGRQTATSTRLDSDNSLPSVPGSRFTTLPARKPALGSSRMLARTHMLPPGPHGILAAPHGSTVRTQEDLARSQAARQAYGSFVGHGYPAMPPASAAGPAPAHQPMHHSSYLPYAPGQDYSSQQAFVDAVARGAAGRPTLPPGSHAYPLGPPSGILRHAPPPPPNALGPVGPVKVGPGRWH